MGGFIRMFFRYSQDNDLKTAIVDPHAWLKNRGTSNPDGLTIFAKFIGFLLGFFLQWVLEVLGAGGATWGMSEVWKLRGERTTTSDGLPTPFLLLASSGWHKSTAPITPC